MADVPDIPRPSQLWKQLTPERKQAAAEAFWADESASMEQTEALLTIAQALKFRGTSGLKMRRDKKPRHLIGLPVLPEPIAARLLVAYHLGQQRPMMASFLDGLGVKHEEGLIADEELSPPSAEALQGAVRGLAASYSPEDVALYLSTLIWQDPDTWGALAELPESKLPARV